MDIWTVVIILLNNINSSLNTGYFILSPRMLPEAQGGGESSWWRVNSFCPTASDVSELGLSLGASSLSLFFFFKKIIANYHFKYLLL